MKALFQYINLSLPQNNIHQGIREILFSEPYALLFNL
jgi:hypothetical protein